MTKNNIAIFLLSEGYFNIKEISGRGMCGLLYQLYTVSLCYGLDETGVAGRYCFEYRDDAVKALSEWNGIGDPSGNWVKHKGWKYGEYLNPNYIKD